MSGQRLKTKIWLVNMADNDSPLLGEYGPLYFHWSVKIAINTVNAPEPDPSISTGAISRSFATNIMVNIQRKLSNKAVLSCIVNNS